MRNLMTVMLAWLLLGSMCYADVIGNGGVWVNGNYQLTGAEFNDDVVLENEEKISNSTDGTVCIEGSGGTNNEDICFDLETNSNRVTLSSTTGVSDISYGALSLWMLDDQYLYAGSSKSDAALAWETTGNDNLQVGVSVGGATASGYMSLMEYADLGNANRSPTGTSADPVFRVYSSDAAEALDYIEMYHDGTHGYLTTGTNDLILTIPDELAIWGDDGDSFFAGKDSSGSTMWGVRGLGDYDQNLFTVSEYGGKQLVLTNVNNQGRDHDHATQTNPTLYVHSDTNPDTDNTEWLSLSHDQTDGNIRVGTGDINIGDGTKVEALNILGLGESVTAAQIGLYEDSIATIGGRMLYDGGTNYLNIETLNGGSPIKFISMNRTGNQLVFNEGSINMAIRMESENSDNALFIEGSNGEISGDPFSDQRSAELAGTFLDVLTDPKLLLAWTDPHTTEQDLSGSNHDASYHVSITTEDQINKGFVWALDMDGTDDYLSIIDHDDFSFGDGSTDSAFSVGAWVQVVDTGASQRILTKWDATTGAEAGEWVFYLKSNERLEFVLRDESANVNVVRLQSSAISTGWHFLVATYDGAGGATAMNNAKIYVDGLAVASTASNNGSYVAMENLASAPLVATQEDADGGFDDSVFQGDMGAIFLEAAELTANDIWKMYVKTCGYYNECSFAN